MGSLASATWSSAGAASSEPECVTGLGKMADAEAHGFTPASV